MLKVMQESFEDALARQMSYQSNNEKSFIDKLTAKEDVMRMRELHKKLLVTREEVMEMLQLMVGNEAKLLNFDEGERYIFGRYFIKIREGFQIDEAVWDLFETIAKDYAQDKEVMEIWRANIDSVNSTSKFFVDNFQFLTRSGMSIDGAGFDNILKNRFELAYPSKNPVQESKRGLLESVFGRGGN